MHTNYNFGINNQNNISFNFTTPTESTRRDSLNLSLSCAEKLFKKISTATPEEKEFLGNHLKESYFQLCQLCKLNKDQIPKDLHETAARLFYLYGRIVYGGDMEQSSQMFQLSLTLQLVKLNVLDDKVLPRLTKCDRLALLPETLTNERSAFKQLNDILTTTTEKELITYMQNQGNEKAFITADTLRHLGYTWQNHDDYDKPENLELFKKIYGSAKQVFINIDTQDSHWEVAQIIYNTARYLILLKDEKNIKGAMEALKELVPYLEKEGKSLRAQVLRAQIHNITMINYSKIIPQSKEEHLENLQTQYKEMLSAMEISENTPDFNAFLKTMFRNNRSRLGLELLEAGKPVETIEQIEDWMVKNTNEYKGVLKTIEEANYDHYYHCGYVCNAARIALHKSLTSSTFEFLDQAQIYLDLALKIANKYPNNNAEDLKKIKSLNERTSFLRMQTESTVRIHQTLSQQK